MRTALLIRNRETQVEFKKGFFSPIMQAYCEKEPDVFEIVYEESVEVEQKETHTEESLKKLSMSALRVIYNILSEDRMDAPPPTTSVGGIIKSILKMQEG